MKTEQFLELLVEHQNKALLFEYLPTQFVGTNYHITEVKHVSIESVDCGKQTHSWKENIIQLWESPSEIGKSEYMSVYKAMGILKKVAKMKPFEMDAEIKFEYSNPEFHTAHLFVNDFSIEGNNLILKLGVEKTDCKAKELCGVSESVSVSDNEPCCLPDGNCC